MVSDKRPSMQNFNVQRGSYSAKIQSRVIGFVLQGHVMTSDKYVKFQCQIIIWFLRKGIACKTLTWYSKYKRGNNSANIQSRVMGLVRQGHVMTLDESVMFQ